MSRITSQRHTLLDTLFPRVGWAGRLPEVWADRADCRHRRRPATRQPSEAVAAHRRLGCAPAGIRPPSKIHRSVIGSQLEGRTVVPTGGTPDGA